MYNSLLLLVTLNLTLLLPNLGQTGEIPTASPRQLNVSAKQLDNAVALFRTAIQKDQLRNVELMVLRDGQIILHEALGWQNKQAGASLKRNTLFRMASNTKAVIATGILLLQEEGKLSVKDPICKHLPAFDNEKCRQITIHHLLTHTSGLRIKTLFLQPLMNKSKEHPDAPNLQLEVNRFANVGPAEAVGKTYSYNNPGYNTLAAIIEVVSGEPLEEFLTKRIYNPLKMTDTSNHPPAEKLNRMAYVYAYKAGKWTVRFKQEARMHIPFIRGSGGMVSTTTDYARFCQMYLDQGQLPETRFLTARSVQQGTSPQTRAIYTTDQAKDRSDFYGYGWKVHRDGTFSHSGSEGTFAWVNPQQRIIGLVFTQSPGGKNPRDQFRELVTQACGPLPATRSRRLRTRIFNLLRQTNNNRSISGE